MISYLYHICTIMTVLQLLLLVRLMKWCVCSPVCCWCCRSSQLVVCITWLMVHWITLSRTQWSSECPRCHWHWTSADQSQIPSCIQPGNVVQQ